MARIKWEYQQADNSWTGRLGDRIAFRAVPDDVEAWELRFVWTGGIFGPIPTVGKTREIAELKLVLFAEQTGLTLPEDVEEETTLAEELIGRLQSEVRWFKDGENDEQRATYVAVQALMVFEEFLKAQVKSLEGMSKDPEYYGAFNILDTMIDVVQQAQEDLGVEVEREAN
jgi:hypothetical protein